MSPKSYVVTARTIIPMSGEKEARGNDLFKKIPKIDNGYILVHEGHIAAIGAKKDFSKPASLPSYDLGVHTLIPGTINCHAHLDLSHLAGKTQWNAGFSTWLTSLIPHAPRNPFTQASRASIDKGIEEMSQYGTSCVGAICAPNSELVNHMESVRTKYLPGIHYFCECFGFSVPSKEELEKRWGEMPNKKLSFAGHALYSTDARTLTLCTKFAQEKKLPFSLHLAESVDETNMLTSAKGDLYAIFRETVLPKNWICPRMRPFSYAYKLNLINKNLLAVHCVHLTFQEAQLLAAQGASICLCPRSNANLAVGEAPIEDFIQSKNLLCLGTDG